MIRVGAVSGKLQKKTSIFQSLAKERIAPKSAHPEISGILLLWRGAGTQPQGDTGDKGSHLQEAKIFLLGISRN